MRKIELHPVTGRRRRGPMIATGLVVLSVGVGLLVAIQSVRGAGERFTATRKTLQDHADFAALMVASHAYRRLGDLATQTLTLWRAGGRPWVPSEFACAQGNAGFTEGSRATLRVVSGALSPAQVAFLEDSIVRRDGGQRLLEEARFRLRYVNDPTGAAGGFLLFRRGGLIGVSACVGGSARDRSIFRDIMLTERVLPSNSVGDLPADSVYSLTVTAGGNRTLYASPNAGASPYTGTALVGADLFGDLTIRVALRPQVAARLVASRYPLERTPLVLGLLALSAALAVAALVQFRREHRLILARAAFIAGVSHELRTPLAQILLFTDLLKSGKLRSESERTRSLRIIDQETHRLIQLVENVLQFPRAGGPPRGAPGVPIPLAGQVQETFEAFRPLASARGVTLRSDIPEGLSVRVDRQAVRQILLNLLDNAVKYGPAGQTVTVRAQAVHGQARIAVEDQGPGIPRSDWERVWKTHHRLARDVGSSITGSGLGLAVVRSLVEDWGGRSWVEDSTSGGARFFIELPATDGAAT